MSRQDGYPHLRRLQEAHRGPGGDRPWQALVCRAFRVRQVREALPRQPPLRAQGAGLLRDPLPPVVWGPLLRVQLRYLRRRVHGPQQGLEGRALRLLRLRPEDDSQDQVLRGGSEARVQKVLREVPQRSEITIEEVS